jgi:hypothetical protein
VINKISAVVASLAFSITAFGFDNPVSTDIPLAIESGVASTIPGGQRIKDDLQGQFMYVVDDEMGFWSFSDFSAIEIGNITSSRRVGERLVFSYSMFLPDGQSADSVLLRANALITYQQVDGAWQFHSIEGQSIQKTGMAQGDLPDGSGEDC